MIISEIIHTTYYVRVHVYDVYNRNGYDELTRIQDDGCTAVNLTSPGVLLLY